MNRLTGALLALTTLALVVLCPLPVPVQRTGLLVWFAAIGTSFSITDLRERRIPNGASLVMACGGLMVQGAAFLTDSPLIGLVDPVQGLAVAALVLVCGVAGELAWRALHGGAHGMGFGDVKLLAACAVWLGPWTLAAVMLACICALVVELPRGRKSFPFGPYIVFASGACLAACLFV